MYRINQLFLNLVLVLIFSNFANAQASVERKLILGVWIDDSKSWQIHFKSNGECVDYIPFSKKSNTYTYRVLDTVPDCVPSLTTPVEKWATFLEMKNKKTGLKLCYEINGFTDNTLSITPLGEGGHVLFNRVKN